MDPDAVKAAVAGIEDPLSVIQAYTDLLMDETAGELTESQRSFLRTIRESTRQLDEVLEVLRILGSDGPPPHPDPPPALPSA